MTVRSVDGKGSSMSATMLTVVGILRAEAHLFYLHHIVRHQDAEVSNNARRIEVGDAQNTISMINLNIGSCTKPSASTNKLGRCKPKAASASPILL